MELKSMLVELDEEEQFLVGQLLLLTGREDSRSELDESQKRVVKAIWPHLKESIQSHLNSKARCDLVNRILLVLGIRPLSYALFETVLGMLDFSNRADIQRCVERFRILCMLAYGSFRFGYKQFNSDGVLFKDAWDTQFPTEDQINERARDLLNRPGTLGLAEIDRSQLFLLGYLAKELAPRVSEARTTLLNVLKEAIKKNAPGWAQVEGIAREKGTEDLPRLLDACGIPGTSALYELPLWMQGRAYSEILHELADSCYNMDKNAVTEAVDKGRRNTSVYLSMHDLDVYVATSMRLPRDFATNWALVRELFHSGKLKDWKLRYFDPTQSHLDDRIQKGLVECLMIKRAHVIVYNAQEADTFGKDAELGVTLAQGKPAIVYVARLFADDPTFSEIYRVLDEALRLDRVEFLAALQQGELLDESELEPLRMPEKGKRDALTRMLELRARTPLQEKDEAALGMELVRQGYAPPDTKNELIKYSLERIINLEKRALTFRDMHPLALQTGPDGVARGVIVTRSIVDTAAVLGNLLVGAMEYEINDEPENWLLVDRITKSPVRVVTKNRVLSAAFWATHWAKGPPEA